MLDANVVSGYGTTMQNGLSPTASTLLAVLMVGAFALIWGGIAAVRRRDRTKGALMLICGAVLIANVLIWTI